MVGGGCYGSQYVRQLRRARVAGRVTFERVVVVDRDPSCAFARARDSDAAGSLDLGASSDQWQGIDLRVAEWTAFFTEWLANAVDYPAPHGRDAIVPSPLMPHLLFEWLADRARGFGAARELPQFVPPEVDGVPWQKAGGDGTRYVSYATWICPINCIEPAKCPHTRGPRDWSLHETLVRESRGDAVALLRVTHRAFGVGMIDVADVIAAHDVVRRAVVEGKRVRVATASHCHGAVAGIGAA